MTILHRHLRLDERALRYFLAVHESGSIRLAAERVSISPSAVSRKLAELELDLGLLLFEKTPKGMRPTAEADRLAVHIQERNRKDREVLLELSAGTSLRGEVWLACGEGFLAGLMHGVLPSFRAAFPNTRVRVEVAGSGELMEAVERDVVDLGVIFARFDPHAARVMRRALHPLAVVGGPAFLARAPERPRLRDLADIPCALLSPRFGVRELLDGVQREQGFALSCALECNSVSAARLFAEAGEGLTFLPAFAAPAEEAGGRLVMRPLDEPDLARVPAELVARRERDLSAAVLALADHIGALHPAFARDVLPR